jgi:hypothetical protein
MTFGKSKIISLSVVVLSFLAFFTGFLFNPFKVLVKDKFLDNQAESLVLGRLVKSRTDGIFSSGGLCGRSLDNPKDSNLFDYQYYAFKNDIPCKKYYPYLSQIGFHAAVYSLIDKASPFSSPVTLKLLRAFKVALLAGVMSFIVYWFFLEFGIIAALFVFLGILLTPSFTFLGRDLWFCIWTNFLPMLAGMFLLRRELETGKPSGLLILLFVNLAILVNFIFNGYEWVSTTLVMATIPFFYYWRKGNWPFKRLFSRIAWIAAGSLVSILATFTILAHQVSMVKGNFSDGIDWIIFSFQKRSYGGGEELPEVFAKQVHHPLSEVFLRYLGGPAFLLPGFITGFMPWYLDQVFFAELVALFMLISLLALPRFNLLKLKPEQRKTLANLSVATWIALLAPFSWYIIFKGHAWSHYHINYITWFMPFCLFGLAMTGKALSYAVRLKFP